MVFTMNGHRYFIDWYGNVVRIDFADTGDWEAEWRAFELWRLPPTGNPDQ